MSTIFTGEIRQNGYVVRDIHAGMEHWTEKLGIGPWFYFADVPVEDFTCRGNPSDVKVSIALTNCGPLQVELIQQRNDAPSMYKEFLDAGHEGLQHVAFWTEEMDAELDRLGGLGYEIGQSGNIGEGGRFVYFDTEAHPGTVIELSEISGLKGQFFKHIRETCANWDGSEPIREMG